MPCIFCNDEPVFETTAPDPWTRGRRAITPSWTQGQSSTYTLARNPERSLEEWTVRNPPYSRSLSGPSIMHNEYNPTREQLTRQSVEIARALPPDYFERPPEYRHLSPPVDLHFQFPTQRQHHEQVQHIPYRLSPPPSHRRSPSAPPLRPTDSDRDMRWHSTPTSWRESPITTVSADYEYDGPRPTAPLDLTSISLAAPDLPEQHPSPPPLGSPPNDFGLAYILTRKIEEVLRQYGVRTPKTRT